MGRKLSIKNKSYPVKICLVHLEPTALLKYINITSKNTIAYKNIDTIIQLKMKRLYPNLLCNLTKCSLNILLKIGNPTGCSTDTPNQLSPSSVYGYLSVIDTPNQLSPFSVYGYLSVILAYFSGIWIMALDSLYRDQYTCVSII